MLMSDVLHNGSVVTETEEQQSAGVTLKAIIDSTPVQSISELHIRTPQKRILPTSVSTSIPPRNGVPVTSHASVRTQGSAVFNNEVAEEPEPIVLRTEYLVLAKSSVPLQDTNTLYSVDYMFDGMYSSIICTKEFYDSVQVGDVLSALE